MKTWGRALLLLSFVFVAMRAEAATPRPETLLLNREGAALLKKQSFQSALDKFIEGLRFDPFQPELHLNMGLAFEGLQQNEKAQASYHQAGELATTPELKFMAFFNEAQLLGKAKKVDEALTLYQKALGLLPTSKEVKTNIELLTQDQQGKGGGKGEDNKDQNNKDQKQDQKQDQQNKDQDKKDQKDNKDQDKDGKDKDQKKQYQSSPKYQPRKFDSKELSEGDVKKILGELRQQEQKIRAEFNRKEVKEQPRAKDW